MDNLDEDFKGFQKTKKMPCRPAGARHTSLKSGQLKMHKLEGITSRKEKSAFKNKLYTQLLPQGIQTSQPLTYFISPEVFKRSPGSSSSIHEDLSSPDTNRVPTAGARHAQARREDWAPQIICVSVASAECRFYKTRQANNIASSTNKGFPKKIILTEAVNM